MKTRFAVIRKEADELRSKGLHREARDLYGRFVASSAEIGSAVKSAIEEELKHIESVISSSHGDEIPERSAGRVGRIGNGSIPKAPAVEPGFRFRIEEPSKTVPSAQEKTSVEGPDWLDGMADIYSLIAREPDPASSPDSEAEDSDAVKQPRLLPMQRPSKTSGLHRGSSLKFYLIGIAVIVVLAAYSVKSLFLSTSDRQHEPTRQALTVVYGKIPSPPGNAAAATPLSKGPEDSTEKRLEQKSGPGVVAGPGDFADGKEVERSRLLTSEDSAPRESRYSGIPDAETRGISPPAEPDPGAAIDFVLKKRRLDF